MLVVGCWLLGEANETEIGRQNAYAWCISALGSTLVLSLSIPGVLYPVALLEGSLIASIYTSGYSLAERERRAQPIFWTHTIVLFFLFYGPALAMPFLRPHFCALWLAGVLTYLVRNVRSPWMRLFELGLVVGVAWLAVAWAAVV